MKECQLSSHQTSSMHNLQVASTVKYLWTYQPAFNYLSKPENVMSPSFVLKCVIPIVLGH